jgi:PAN domain-containing protein
VQDNCCVSGVRGAGVVESRNGGVETSIDRPGGDYRSFDAKSGEGDEACKAACTADNKCRAWTYVRPGYLGKEARCLLKKDIKPPRRRAGFISGVVR